MTEVASRAHRALRRMENYQDLTKDSVPAELNLPLADGERVIGIYRNDPHDLHEAIVFTDKGLYVNKNTVWQRLLFSEIERILSSETKQDVAGMTILRHDGTRFYLPAKGSLPKSGSEGSRTYDVFGVLRFLLRVTEDLVRQ